MEDRITRLEEKVDHLQSDVTEIKGDIKRLDAGLNALRVETKDSIASLRLEMHKGFSSMRIWALTILTGFSGALLFTLARGFKWL